MATPSSPSASAPAGPSVLQDLPAKGADLVDSLADLVRNKAVAPLTLVARAIVFGLIVFTASLAVVTLLAITVVRLLTVYAFDGRVWLSDVVVGGLFVVVGIVAWSLRTAKAGS